MNKHTIKYSDTYEVLIYLGTRERYHGPVFSKRTLFEAIKEFQEDYKNSMPVRVSEATFMKGDYEEDGYEISGICYPNKTQSTEYVKVFMLALAEMLLYKFNQNRMTVRILCDRPQTIMLEQVDAETTHKIN